MQGRINTTDNNCYFGIEADDSCAVEGYGIPELLQKQRREKEILDTAESNEAKRLKALEKRKQEVQ